jgi:integrase
MVLEEIMSELKALPSDTANLRKGAPRGQKRPFRPREVWAIRARLEMLGEVRNLALLNLAIDSKLRGCDLVRLKVSDVFSAGSVRERAMVIQKKTARPVQFEITKLTATSLVSHVQKANLSNSDFLFPSRNTCSAHLSTRQYHRIVDKWVRQIGLKVSDYGTHSLRRTKVAQLYRNTGNLRAVQLLLGHAKIESTIRYLGIELEDALQISEALEI